MQSTVQKTEIREILWLAAFKMLPLNSWISLFLADKAGNWRPTLTNSALETYLSIFPRPFKSKLLSTVHFTDDTKCAQWDFRK